ncbi:similar to Saccharomyces cerevisiae YDR298C ATP5 Subunit 5 of the stator stalk of mitochondrial F1F0 ATP synthase [Maudiozyma saulgeensis]|uniref:ATP synthase subunit 5, mitochondrial n=1 Tax=Maudiozyma saulgeensis TaxID=1789683 RepID=A0A1X7R597_9SACH|nr:similar to Saccharomyces cerevisiae YDR298C ATP5 Subunit 5 of the stator stalk of mitochondrial F1F0 ATP synthase [Kazachstania saulgeensis]
MFNRQFVRLASNAAKKPQTLRLYGVDGTYATALFDVAVAESRVNQVASSLTAVNNMLRTDAKLAHIFQNPALSLKDRQTVAQTVVNNGSIKVEPAVANFLNVLAENNRLSLLEKIAADFAKLDDHYNGVVNASITTVQPLDNKSFKRIEKALAASALVGSEKTLKLTNNIDPQIQGGLVVEIADRTVDLSIAARIQKLNKILDETV